MFNLKKNQKHWRCYCYWIVIERSLNWTRAGCTCACVCEYGSDAPPEFRAVSALWPLAPSGPDAALQFGPSAPDFLALAGDWKPTPCWKSDYWLKLLLLGVRQTRLFLRPGSCGSTSCPEAITAWHNRGSGTGRANQRNVHRSPGGFLMWEDDRNNRNKIKSIHFNVWETQSRRVFSCGNHWSQGFPNYSAQHSQEHLPEDLAGNAAALAELRSCGKHMLAVVDVSPLCWGAAVRRRKCDRVTCSDGVLKWIRWTACYSQGDGAHRSLPPTVIWRSSDIFAYLRCFTSTWEDCVDCTLLFRNRAVLLISS